MYGAYSFYRIIFSCQAMPAPPEFLERLPKPTLTAFGAESYVDAEANFSEEHTPQYEMLMDLL